MKVVELTIRIDENTSSYPGDPGPKIEQISKLGSQSWNMKRFSFNSHFATHIDAPAHMVEGGKSLDKLPPETFAGEGVVLDACNPDLSLVKEGDIVFFCACEEETEYYEDKLVISLEVANELVKKKVKLVGFDLPGPDYPPFELHKLFFSHDIPMVENLTNLKKLTNTRCTLIALPLYVKDSDGSPCRALAMLD
jgi:kynurenine formamidase